MCAIGYYVDIEFIDRRGKAEWFPYGVPGEEPQCYGVRMDAITEARRLSSTYGKRTRVRGGRNVHGYILPDGVIVNA